MPRYPMGTQPLELDITILAIPRTESATAEAIRREMIRLQMARQLQALPQLGKQSVMPQLGKQSVMPQGQMGTWGQAYTPITTGMAWNPAVSGAAFNPAITGITPWGMVGATGAVSPFEASFFMK